MKFKIGDEVEIVNYGHNIWSSDGNGHFEILDIAKGVIGQKGVIVKVLDTQGIPKYAIDGIIGKHAWFDEQQLKYINLLNN